MRPFLSFCLLACLAIPGAARAAALCAGTGSVGYACAPITVSTGGSTWTNGINHAGTVAGFAQTPGTRGYRLPSGGAAQFFDAPGSSATFAYGINDAGSVSGNFTNAAGDHGFVDGIAFDAPGAAATYGYGIDAGGAVAGFYTTAIGGPGTGFVRAASGSFSSFQVAGQATYAYGVAGGVVVGSYVDALRGPLGFIKSGNTFTDYQVAGAAKTYLRGINTLGDLVGSYVDSLGRTHGFAQLNGVFWTVDIAGADSTVAAGVNDLRQVVGYSTAGSTTAGFLAVPQPLPLPASLPLFVAALFGTALLRRRRT